MNKWATPTAKAVYFWSALAALIYIGPKVTRSVEDFLQGLPFIQTTIGEDQMQVRDDLVFAPNQSDPFTGVVVKKYESGNKEWEKTYKDGIKHGIWVQWYETGQKESERRFKNGFPYGNWTSWHENGRLKSQSSWAVPPEGLAWLKDGRKATWHENGQMKSEGFYRDGKKKGKWTEWNQNGEVTKQRKY